VNRRSDQSSYRTKYEKRGDINYLGNIEFQVEQDRKRRLNHWRSEQRDERCERTECCGPSYYNRWFEAGIH